MAGHCESCLKGKNPALSASDIRSEMSGYNPESEAASGEGGTEVAVVLKIGGVT